MTSSSYDRHAPRLGVSLNGLCANLPTNRNILAARVRQRKQYREGITLADADLAVMISYLRREIDLHYAGKRPAVQTASTIKVVHIEREQASMKVVALNNGQFAIYAASQRPKGARSLEDVLDSILDLIGDD